MKAGIITYHSAVNFGAALQACALYSAVRELGHVCEVIDYRPPIQREGAGIFRPVRGLRDAVKNGGSLVFYPRMKRARERFGAFLKEELTLTGRYDSYEALREEPPQTDALICGSDQIWNTPGYADPAYYLEFGNDSQRRLAYAPSFGDAAPSPAQLELAKRCLSRFSAVSVREAGAIPALAHIGVSAVPVLDPVLLKNASYWRSLAGFPNLKTPYLLCYPLYNPPCLNGLLRELRAKTGLPVVVVTTEPISRVIHDRIIRDAGPREFLGLLMGAEMVVTSSFHGTALSLLMGKPFFAVTRPGSRVADLLGRLALTDRLYDGGGADLRSLYRADWIGAYGRLKEAREASMSFLSGALCP